MEKLASFQSNDPKKLFVLAQKLNERKFFELFLNESQFKIIDYIIKLNNFEVWTNFLEGNCYISYIDDIKNVTTDPTSHNIDSNSSEQSEEGKGDDSSNMIVETQEEIAFDEGIKMSKMLALHIRYLLWEKAIDFYYSSKELDSSQEYIEEVTDDFELIDSLDTLDDNDDKQDQPEGGRKDVIEKPVIREVEDDYDDDDDDDEEEEEKENQDESISKEVPDSDDMLNYNFEKQLVLEIPKSIFIGNQDNTEATEQSINTTTATTTTSSTVTKSSSPAATSSDDNLNSNEDQDKLVREFNKVYHNFEYDRDTLLKRRKLEKSDLQLQEPKENGHLEHRHKQKDSTSHMDINLGAASTSLQHLLSTIQQKRDQVPLNDHDLRNLFMDVRKNRGKWANDDRVGQEELYEACEKVVTELRGYTEHSTPFLNKVSKREAPNYGLIIKKPMDLNTVLKKLKGLSYNSKQEFVDDLMLIWNNCLTYNADPRHFLRAHALAMQKKTLKLVPTIPDITIRSRADVEKEEEAENYEKKDEKFHGGKSMKKGRKRSRQDQIKAEIEAARTPSVPGTPMSVCDSLDERGSETPGPENGNMSGLEDEDEDEEENDNMNGANGALSGEEEDEFDPELQAWRGFTAKSRANYCSARADLFDEQGHLRPDAYAIIRQSNEMANFNQYLANREVISKATSLLETDEPYLLEYDVTGGVPGFSYKGIDKEEEDRREENLVDVYLQQTGGDASKMKSGFVLANDRGLNGLYYENICEIQEIKKVCFKISLIRQMQQNQFVHHTQMKQPEIEKLKEVDVDAASKLPSRDPNAKDVQFSVLRRNVAKIAMQTGFESTEPFAINTLTQIAEKYIGNLVKSIKLHSETNSKNKLNPKEIILLSLLENGVDKPDDLYTFIQERIIKQQDKLKDLRVKLSNFLKDLLRPGLENFNEKSFDDNSEQFMTGDFSNDLGDDFFGFKELGLDKEFNMLSSSIPIYLLHSRLHNQFASASGVSLRNKYEDLNEYVPANLTVADVKNQVGVLIPFYTKLSDKSKAHFIKLQKKKGEPTDLPEDHLLLLIDDEELPQKQRNIRPRMPPTGKITTIKKKIIANSFFLPEEETLLAQEANASQVTLSNDVILQDDFIDPTLGTPKKGKSDSGFSSPLNIKSEA